MASEEDRQLMQRISHLAGQINRHRNQQLHPHRYSPYGRPAPRGRGRGYPGAAPQSRHLTLVNTPPPPPTTTATTTTTPTTPASDPAWIQRNDRHLQLINASVYEQDRRARVQAVAETNRLRRQAKDAHEQSALASQFAQGPAAAPPAGGLAAMSPSAAAAAAATTTTPATPATPAYEITVHGIPFGVTKNGAKLVKIPGRISSDQPTPKTAVVAGVLFRRSKNGNLYRNGVAQAQRYVAPHLIV
jgi:hypothetical protein